MSRRHPLERLLGPIFKKPKVPDRFRRARAAAKALSALYGIEIEKFDRGYSGFNVWPPKDWEGPDPFEGDHYCSDWDDALEAVETYVRMIEEASK